MNSLLPVVTSAWAATVVSLSQRALYLLLSGEVTSGGKIGHLMELKDLVLR